MKTIYYFAILLLLVLSACKKKGSDTPTPQPPTITSFNPTSAEIGATVTITGKNFSATTTDNVVQFNGVDATVTKATTTDLTVTVPQGATTGPITVSVGGLNATSTSNFTVLKWIQKADFAGDGRNRTVGFSIGNKGYIGTGLIGLASDLSGYKKDFWEYDVATNTWTQKADFGGTARFGAIGFVIGSKGYIGTGKTGPLASDIVKDFWEYDPATNIWTKKADFGGSPITDAVGFTINGKGYLGTGFDTGYRKDFWEYNAASNTWTQKADFGGTARLNATGFSIGSKGYLGTGEDISSSKKDFWEYDVASNTWTQKADFGGTARRGAAGFSVGNKGYIGTGSSGNNQKDFWEYDVASNTWTQKADFGGVAVSNCPSFSTSTRGYMVLSKQLWVYVP